MAAAGQQVSLPAAPMSAVSAAPAAAPMQAKKDKNLTMEERVRKMHAIRGQASVDDTRIRRKDQRWYNQQMQNMSPEMLAEISRQQTEAAGNVANEYQSLLDSGMSEDEASVRAHFSDSSDALQGYQSLLSNYGIEFDQSGGDYVRVLAQSMTDDDRETRERASNVAERALHHNNFYGSEAGRAFRAQAQDARDRKTYRQYKRLR